MQSTPLRIGTRGSPLALAQAHLAAEALAATGDDAPASEIVAIRTSGDRITDRPLADVGGKGLFTKEIDEALLAGSVDLTVHSAKDLETHLPEGIVIAACLPREDVRDVFLSPRAATLDDLPAGATVGTASMRRQALVLHRRPDLKVATMRGNVQTRLAKLDHGEADATLLALAGLNRLGIADRASSVLSVDDWLPAAGQGVVAITVRTNDAPLRERLARLDDRETSIALATERAFLAALDGSCRTPIGALAEVAGERIRLRGLIVTPDGMQAHRVDVEGDLDAAEALGREAGLDLARRGGPDFFR